MKKILAFVLTAAIGVGAALTLWFLATTPYVLGGEEYTLTRELSFNAPLRFEFSTWMSKPSVEENFVLSPEMPGKILWDSLSTIRFVPDKPFAVGAELEVSIGAEAKSLLGRKTGVHFTQKIRIVGVPQVSFLSPVSISEWAQIQKTQAGEKPLLKREEKENVAAEAAPILRRGEQIVVMFDRPLRALGSVEENLDDTLSDFSEYVEFTPKIPGNFHWLGTSAFAFTPDEEAFPMGESFMAQIKAGAPTADGGSLTQDIIWHFETAEPQIIATSPVSGATFVSPRTKVKIEWNQPVNEESFFSHLTVTPDLPEGSARKISVSWDRKSDPNAMFLNFEPSFAQDTTVNVTITAGVQSLSGSKASEQDFAMSFQTLPDPKILSFLPEKNGTIAPDGVLKIRTATPVNVEEIRDHLRFTPEIPKENISIFEEYAWNDLGETTGIFYNISAPFTAQTSYDWELVGGISDNRVQAAEGNIWSKMQEPFARGERERLESEAKITEGFSSSFRTGDFQPYLVQLSRPNGVGVYDAAEPVELFLQHRNISTLDITVCTLAEDRFISTQIRYDSLGTRPCAEQTTKTAWQEEPAAARNTMTVTTSDLSAHTKLPPGVYAYEVTSPEYLSSETKKPVVFSGVLIVNNVSLTAKWSDNEVLIWATDFREGKPVSGLPISIFNDQGTVGKVAGGATDANGLASIALPQNSAEWVQNYFAVGRSNTALGFVGRNWGDGLGPWDFGIDGGWQTGKFLRAYLYTDRPIYRPGQTVYFKGIVRSDDDATLTFPAAKILFARIQSPQGTILYDADVSLSAQGTIDGKFILENQAELGDYFLSIRETKDGYDLFTRSFAVEEYRRPDFKVTVGEKNENPDRHHFFGEKVPLELTANYYFGGALNAAKFAYSIVREPYYFNAWNGPDWYSFSRDENFCYWNCSAPEHFLKGESEQNLDKNGTAQIEIPADLQWEEKEIPGPQLVTVYATVSDTSERSVSSNATVVLLPADGFVGIRPQQYFLTAADTTAAFDLITIDTDNNPRPEEKVEVELFQIEWNSLQKEGVDGNLYWESSREFTSLSKLSTTTNGEGKGSVSFPLPPGDLRYRGELEAVATWEDADGRETSAAVSLYRGTEDYVAFAQQNNDRIELKLDKESYDVGDTAKLLVASPFAKPVPALLTIERQHILEKKIITVKNGEYLEIPVTKEMVPNAFISVVLSKGKGLVGEWQSLTQRQQENTARLQALEENIPLLTTKLSETQNEQVEESTLGIRQHEVRLEVAQERLSDATNEQTVLTSENTALAAQIAVIEQHLTPEEKAQEKATGRRSPRPEIKVGIVSLPINIADKNLRVLIKTDKAEYLPGETVRAEITTQDNDGFGTPADVSLAVVDESILALRSRNLEDLVNFFWGRRPLGVWTTNTLVYFIERLNVQAQGGAKGGGGGLDATELAKRKRGDFRDTAFWKADIQTDKDGKAAIEFVLPDNLTSWQLWAVGNTAATQVGMATQSFVAKKQIMVQSAFPRFALAGDHFTASFLVHNQSLHDETFAVNLVSTNFTLDHPETQTVSIAKEEKTLVSFSGKVEGVRRAGLSFDPMEFTLTAQTADNALRDELTLTVPVSSPAIGENIATSGEAAELATEYARIPQAALSGIGGLDVTLAASRIAPFLRGWEALLNYRYACAEQTMSQAFPDIALLSLQNKLGSKITNALAQNTKRTTAEIRENLTQALQRLYQLHRPDGGFGYWEESPTSSPYLSTYILYGLYLLKTAGETVDVNVLTETESYVRAELYRPAEVDADGNPLFYGQYWERMDDETKAFAVFVLSEMGANDVVSAKNLLLPKRETLSTAGKLFLLMALQNLGSDEIATLRLEVEALAEHTPRGVTFSTGSENFSWALNSDEKTTALALMALSRIDSNHPLLGKIVAGLSVPKDSGDNAFLWGSTQNSAWILLSYLEYLQNTKSTEADFDATVKLNSQNLESIHFNSDNLFTPEHLAAVAIDTLLRSPQVNSLDFSKSGPGTLFYDLVAQYFLPAEKVSEKNEGLGIFRSYYRLDDKKMEHPVNNAVQGETLRGKLTIMVPSERHLVRVSEKLPAGLEPVNFALENEDRSLLLTQNNYQEGQAWTWWDNLWFFTHKEMRDDEILLFADTLPAGMYEYNFYVTANTLGEFQHLPAVAEEMYTPEVFGRTNGEIFTVRK